MITLSDACYIGDDLYSPQEMMGMETIILKALKWKVNYATAGDIARKLLVALNLTKEFDFEVFAKQVDDFIEFCVLGKLYIISKCLNSWFVRTRDKLLRCGSNRVDQRHIHV